MPAPTLSIAPHGALPEATPYLMPFHVEHNGPAPTDTYFLVQAANEHVAKPPTRPEGSNTPSTISNLSRRVTEATTRFIATFRGRTVHGLKVGIPAGYAGVIMVGEGATTGTKASGAHETMAKRVAAKTRGRATRGAKRALDAELEMNLDGDPEAESKDETIQTLLPTARFNSFVLWHPDIPADPGRDEYARALTEWIRLADEIHRVEE